MGAAEAMAPTDRAVNAAVDAAVVVAAVAEVAGDPQTQKFTNPQEHSGNPKVEM